MKRIAFLVAICLAIMSSAYAQVSRATLTGRITDPSGAVIPHAAVTVTNTSTGAVSKTISSASGFYTIPFLPAGPYQVAAKAHGFKRYVQNGVHLETGQRAQQNIVLQVGAATQTVHVTADTALIDTQTASAGQILNSREVEMLPSNGRSPIGLARIGYGVIPKEKHLLTEVRPFDNAGGSDFSMGGGNSQSNEILLNGVPSMKDQTRVSAFSPELDSVKEIAIDDFESSAVYGDTSNGIVNVVTKNGTNHFHGTLSEFNETNALAARLYFQKPGAAIPATRQNQYGLTIGGPVLFPKLYNGRNKLFFFYAFEGFTDSSPTSTITTVPTDAEKKGNFSSLLALGSSYQLYDPYSAVMANGEVERQPYQYNIIPTSQISAVGNAFMQYYPEPNRTGESDGENNYFANTPNTDRYYSNAGRLDYNFSTKNKAFVELHESSVTSSGGNIFHNIATGSSDNTDYWGGTVDDINNFSSSLTLDSRFGFSRSWEIQALPSTGFNPTKLGFPSYISSDSTYHAMPAMYLSGYYSLGGKPGAINASTTLQYFSELTKTWGNNTLEIGPDIRVTKFGGFSPEYASGYYVFSSAWTNAYTGAPAPKYGSGLAELLLGLPDAGAYDVQVPIISSNYYFAGYAQDYWQVKPNLTIDLGLRVEHETAPVESRNRLNNGFDPTATNEVTGPAEAAYAANPIPEMPAGQFQPTGGLTFATPSHRSAYSTQTAYISPRVGLAWSPAMYGGHTVFRAGVGIFYNPFGLNNCCNGLTSGFSETNNMLPTVNGYLSPAATLSNPYPQSNPIQNPTGSALGVNTFLGQDISYVNPYPKAPYSIRWNFDIQQQLGKNTMFQLGYMGSRQNNLAINNDASALPLQYLSRLGKYDPTVTAELSRNVQSPFAGLGPYYGNTTDVASLLQPYPEFSSVTEQLVPAGYSNYNALLARITHRFSHGLQFNANFEWSRQLEASSQLNSGGPVWYGDTTGDFPIHFVLTGVYNLPFGRGSEFLSSVNRPVNLLVGGWALSSIYTWNSGSEIGWGNVIRNWNVPIDSQPRNLNEAFNVNAFDRVNADQMNGYNYRTFPSLYLRSDATNNADLSVFKKFKFPGNVQLQYRLDAFNAFNRPQFAAPNTNPTSSAFGKITSQANTSRVLQMGLRLSF